MKIKLLITAILIGLPILLSADNTFAANAMTADVYSFTIVPDITPPYTSGHVPAKDATSITTDSNIVVHVKDDGVGVDSSTIKMIVNGVSVSPLITGTPADYTLTYNPLSDFLNGQSVFVTIQASDLAP